MPRTLLLADDNATIRRLVALTLEGEDISVIAVNDGDEAIAALNRQPADIVLADVGATGHGGYDVARHIRATPHLAHIPVLLMSGAFEPLDPAAAEAAGCAGVLTKPLEPRRVIGRVRELLARGTPAPPPASTASPVAAPADLLRTAVPEFDNRRHEPLQPAPPPAPTATPTALEVEGYFDRLDQALATRIAAPPQPPVPVIPLDAPADAWPTAAAEPRLPPAVDPALTPHEIVEQAARLVLERLSDDVVRETVGRIVTERADRLIREEIDRIKSNIK